MATRRAASIGLIIALTIIVGGALVWNRIFRSPLGPRHPLPRTGALLVIEHGGVPPRQRRQPEAKVETPPNRRPGPQKGQRQPPPAVRTHVVRDGESLSSIAQEVYRRSSRWPEIARANGLSEPYLIRAGQTLRIP